jgi:hypothetical protein
MKPSSGDATIDLGDVEKSINVALKLSDLPFYGDVAECGDWVPRLTVTRLAEAWGLYVHVKSRICQRKFDGWRVLVRVNVGVGRALRPGMPAADILCRRHA